MRSDYNHEVLATEREPEGQAKRSKSDRTGLFLVREGNPTPNPLPFAKGEGSLEMPLFFPSPSRGGVRGGVESLCYEL